MNANTRETIDCFDGLNRFLSNFFGSPVYYKGIRYANNEQAYQAQKDPSRAKEFLKLTPGQAKRLGQRVNLRPDWEQVKLPIMKEIVLAKFEQNPYLAKRLLATGNATLIEGNTWGDKFFGICRGEGRNELGKALMQTRDLLKQKQMNGVK